MYYWWNPRFIHSLFSRCSWVTPTSAPALLTRKSMTSAFTFCGRSPYILCAFCSSCLRSWTHIRESVDSLYRDGADTQYIQYLSKSHETQPRTRFKLKELPSVHLWVILQPAKPTSFPKSIVEESYTQKCVVAKLPFSSHHDFVQQW